MIGKFLEAEKELRELDIFYLLINHYDIQREKF